MNNKKHKIHAAISLALLGLARIGHGTGGWLLDSYLWCTGVGACIRWWFVIQERSQCGLQ